MSSTACVDTVEDKVGIRLKDKHRGLIIRKYSIARFQLVAKVERVSRQDVVAERVSSQGAVDEAAGRRGGILDCPGGNDLLGNLQKQRQRRADI